MNINECLESYINRLNEDRIRKTYVPDLDDRVRKLVGISRYNDDMGLRLENDSTTPNIMHGRISFDWKLSKDAVKKIAEEKIEHLRNIGAKAIKYKKSEGYLYFDIDVTALKDQLQADETAAETAYTDALNTVDIDKYKPTDKILDKLNNYRQSGSKVNVKAIKDMTKKLTYYYGAKLLGWNDLAYDLKNTVSYYASDDDKNMFDAIDKRIAADAGRADTRSKDQISFQSHFRNIANLLADNNINYTFKMRNTYPGELDKDSRNGRCWTIGYRLSFPDYGDQYIDFCHHTSESCDGGDYGWGYNGYTGDYGKREIEARLMQDIHNITGI